MSRAVAPLTARALFGGSDCSQVCAWVVTCGPHMDSTAQTLMSQLRQRPLDAAILEALRSHCEAAEDPATWAEALEYHARAAEGADADPIALGRLHFELGNLYRDHLRRLDRAVQHYRAAADCDPAQRPAIAAARALFAEAGKWDQVAKLASLEAESLPAGAKRANLLAELADVLVKRLGDRPGAVEALRDALESAPSNLDLRHQLATNLLDMADQEVDADKALGLRVEAAHALTEMAKRVTDDYAFAYAEAALDAVPNHEGALGLLESIAPRVDRDDAVAMRWVAALQASPSDPGARVIRLKLARAYEVAGQLSDAKACLEPIATADDPEARALLASLSPAEKSRPLALFVSDDPFPGSDISLADELVASGALHREPSTRLRVDESEDLGEVTARAAVPESTRIMTPDERKASLAGAEEEEVLTVPGVPETLREVIGGTQQGVGASSPAVRSADAIGSEKDDLTRPARAAETDEAGATQALAVAQEADRLLEELQRDLVPPDMSERAHTQGLGADAGSAGPAAVLGDFDLTPVPGELEAYAAGGEQSGDKQELDAQLSQLSTDGAPGDSVDTETDAHDRHASVEDLASSEIEVMDADGDDITDVSDDELLREPTSPGVLQAVAARLDELGEAPRSVISTVPPPVPRRARSQPAEAPADPEPVDELTALRNELARLLKFRDRRGAAELAERLFAQGITDAEVISAMEDQFRATRDFRRMRDFALRLAALPELGEEHSINRLREAAILSESKLGDVEGTATALTGLLARRPSDDEAFGKLKRMYQRLGRFDDLAQLLAETAMALATPREQADRFRELFTLHRDKRKSPADAVDALERARAVDPGDLADVIALHDMYRLVGRHADVAAMLRVRVSATEEPVERVPLLVELAEVLEAHLSDVPAAYAATTEALRIAPHHAESLDRAARIETSLQRFDLLVTTLRKKLATLEGPARLPLLLRISDLIMGELNAPADAVDVLREATTLAAGDLALWNKAAIAFDAAGASAELDERLGEVLAHGRDTSLRFDLGGMLAERREAANDLAGAISAREAQLALRREESTLQSLVGLLRRADRASELARRLDDLARMVAPAEARGVRMERASLLSERLQNPEAAKSELERILTDLAPDDAGVLRELVALSRRTDDVARRVRAQERLMQVTREPDVRTELAEDLADTLEHELDDKASAMRVLRAWAEFDRSNPRPRIRLLPMLEAQGERAELVATLDALASLGMADDETGEYTQRAARVSMDLGDFEGAWNRLVPRVVDHGDAAAEELLGQLAVRAQRGEQLAELYVGLAQRATDVAAQTKQWRSAARVFDSMVGDASRALEAVLRAFAKDLDDPSLLGEVERLSEASRNDKRLMQVYDSLVRRAAAPTDRTALLLRHAHLLERRFKDLPQALARAALAYQVDATNLEAYAEAVRMAESAQNPETLLQLHELRAETATEPGQRIDALVAATSVVADDSDRVADCKALLTRAAAAARCDAALLARLEHLVVDMDVLNGGRGVVCVTGVLADAYEALATGSREPKDASLLYARASRLLSQVLKNVQGGFIALARASKAVPEDRALLDELTELALAAGQTAALADHFASISRDAIDSETAVGALMRLGVLYEEVQEDPERAADAYEELVRLRPSDKEVDRRLRNCLRAAGRHKDLLIAIDRALTLEPSLDERVALLMVCADTWEQGLQNRYEACDALRKVLALVPGDPVATAGLERLGRRTSVDEANLLDSDVTVAPEDLLPSLPREEDPAPAAEAYADDVEAHDTSDFSSEETSELQHTAPAQEPADGDLAQVALPDTAFDDEETSDLTDGLQAQGTPASDAGADIEGAPQRLMEVPIHVASGGPGDPFETSSSFERESSADFDAEPPPEQDAETRASNSEVAEQVEVPGMSPEAVLELEEAWHEGAEPEIATPDHVDGEVAADAEASLHDDLDDHIEELDPLELGHDDELEEEWAADGELTSLSSLVAAPPAPSTPSPGARRVPPPPPRAVVSARPTPPPPSAVPPAPLRRS